MAEHLRQIPQEMQISTGEVIASLPIMGFALGMYITVESAIKLKEKAEHILIDFGKSKRSSDVALAGAVVVMPAVLGLAVVDEVFNGGKFFDGIFSEPEAKSQAEPTRDHMGTFWIAND